ncbi:hypothetical protein KEG38_15265 [Polyangium jinanense]|uniref:hypothetical protein n=1 Tax=Polyangium jinanense TaxID=2829994 RepID=UPI00233F7E16|nr:hypothetical protein [Polyangium jinanense]MDC3955223.1 hypothetical protein [Polyangium jinanense]
MFEIVSARRRAIAAGALVAALAACGSEVDIETTGAGGGSSASSASSGDTSVSSSTGGSGGGGGSGGLPAPTCAQGEAAIVAAMGYATSLVAFDHEGTWTKNAYVIGTANALTTYVDVYDHLGVFWIEGSDETAQSRFASTSDGKSFDLHDVHGWFPQPWNPPVTVGRSLLLGRGVGGSILAYFDPDAFDWHPYPDPAPFDLTAAVIREGSGTVLGVGVGPQGELCDTEIFWADGGSWTDMHCRDDIEVFQAEVPVAPPRAVALPNGDVVVVYYESYARIAATRLHEGVWSAPESITLADQSLDLALTATPAGDVIVGMAATTGVVYALRYVPGVGWGEPLPIDPAANPHSAISAAPGICGDDALIAYGAGGIDGEIRVARVRGGAAEATTVAWFTEEIPSQISITTRRPSISP